MTLQSVRIWRWRFRSCKSEWSRDTHQGGRRSALSVCEEVWMWFYFFWENEKNRKLPKFVCFKAVLFLFLQVWVSLLSLSFSYRCFGLEIWLKTKKTWKKTACTKFTDLHQIDIEGEGNDDEDKSVGAVYPHSPWVGPWAHCCETFRPTFHVLLNPCFHFSNTPPARVCFSFIRVITSGIIYEECWWAFAIISPKTGSPLFPEALIYSVVSLFLLRVSEER